MTGVSTILADVGQRLDAAAAHLETFARDHIGGLTKVAEDVRALAAATPESALIGNVLTLIETGMADLARRAQEITQPAPPAQAAPAAASGTAPEAA